MVIFCFIKFHETYPQVILEQRAKRLDRKKSLPSALVRALSRPLRLLATHPIIRFCAAILAFNYGNIYIVLSSFAQLWISQYKLSVELNGLHYLACALGELVAALCRGHFMDWSYGYMFAKSARHVPKHRILLKFPRSTIFCLGLFIYVWAAQYHIHWILVDIDIFLSMFGMQLMLLPLQAYIMDLYPEHTSSALAAVQFPQSLAAFLFPLCVPSLYEALGYGWGNSTLAFVGLVLGVPAPLIPWLYGAKLRDKAQSSYKTVFNTVDSRDGSTYIAPW